MFLCVFPWHVNLITYSSRGAFSTQLILVRAGKFPSKTRAYWWISSVEPYVKRTHECPHANSWHHVSKAIAPWRLGSVFILIVFTNVFFFYTCWLNIWTNSFESPSLTLRIDMTSYYLLNISTCECLTFLGLMILCTPVWATENWYLLDFEP